jgi:hypothetical protein
LQERLSSAADKLSQEMEANREEYQQEYLQAQKDCVEAFEE